MQYIGRFAPSPTGPLHFGSLVAAVASYCDAKAHQGKWLLRMEDIDKPREMPGAADDILRTLETFGFAWDDEIVYQSRRSAMYAEALTKLQAKNLIYPCTCTRKEISDSSQMMGIEGAIYPKICYQKTVNLSTSNFNASASLIDTASQRINVDDAGLITFKDAIQGDISQHLAHDIGDFILKRKDGFFAYQLAVVVDDAAQGVTHIVRGADLLDSTPRQIYLQQLMDIETPHYAHVPVVTNLQGEKLSKQTLAQPLDTSQANIALFDALSFLGQHPPQTIKNATLDEVWRWAITNWQLENAPKSRSLIKNRT
jgi:glutamyl-Q tRNA(Asp) synthetase